MIQIKSVHFINKCFLVTIEVFTQFSIIPSNLEAKKRLSLTIGGGIHWPAPENDYVNETSISPELGLQYDLEKILFGFELFPISRTKRCYVGSGNWEEVTKNYLPIQLEVLIKISNGRIFELPVILYTGPGTGVYIPLNNKDFSPLVSLKMGMDLFSFVVGKIQW